MKLKLTKCQIMTDLKDIKGVKEIYGIELKDKIKYLVVNLFCDRQKTVQTRKNKPKSTCPISKVESGLRTPH